MLNRDGLGAQDYKKPGSGALFLGGLIGISDHERIENSYATGAVTLKKPPKGFRSSPTVGGFSGYLLEDTVSSSYSTGRPEKRNVPGGGFVGVNFKADYQAAYWDIDTTGATSGCARNLRTKHCAVVGLTDAQLKSFLPGSFDPQVWGQAANINSGYPYLLTNPPPKNAPEKRKLRH